MTSRRSMLKWIPAACFAGWWGLRPTAAASPAPTDQAASPPSGESSSCSCESSNRADPAAPFYTTSYTYDGDGRVTSIYHSGGQIIHTTTPPAARQARQPEPRPGQSAQIAIKMKNT